MDIRAAGASRSDDPREARKKETIMSKGYTVKECIEIVNCCYFVGSCHACPACKPTGYANICKCAGNKEVGEALLSILEPVHEAQKQHYPSLFDYLDELAAARQAQTEEAPADPAAEQVQTEETSAEAEAQAQTEEEACEMIKDMVNLDAMSSLEDPEA